MEILAMVMMVPAQSVSADNTQTLSSLTGQGEDEPHAIYNSSRHGRCINRLVMSLGGEEEPRVSCRWRNGRSCGVFDTMGYARLGVRRAACRQEALGGGTKGCRALSAETPPSEQTAILTTLWRSRERVDR
jgi:hypothetical protein